VVVFAVALLLVLWKYRSRRAEKAAERELLRKR
jgi:hypothetical protein